MLRGSDGRSAECLTLRNPGEHTQWCAILEVLPNNALASCHQRASLVIRFRCRGTDAVAAIGGRYNIPLSADTSYYNLSGLKGEKREGRIQFGGLRQSLHISIFMTGIIVSADTQHTSCERPLYQYSFEKPASLRRWDFCSSF